MNIATNRIGFTLVSVEDFTNRTLAQRVIDQLLRAQSPLAPTTYGTFEPSNRQVIPEDSNAIVDVWLNASSKSADAGSLILRSDDVAEYQVAWQRSGDAFFPFIGGSVELPVLRNQPDLLSAYFELIQTLARTVNAVYGEVRNQNYSGWDVPFDLRVRLPDIPWASIYGPPYVVYFGNDRILSAPFNAREAIASETFWLEAATSVFEPVPEETKSAIRRHLGEESFMSGNKWRYQTGKAPALRKVPRRIE